MTLAGIQPRKSIRPSPRALLRAALAVFLFACSPQTGAAPSPATSAASSANPEWEGILAEAKREGMLVIMGPQGDEVREALTAPFQRKYPESHVELTGMAGSQAIPKIGNSVAPSPPPSPARGEAVLASPLAGEAGPRSGPGEGADMRRNFPTAAY